MASRPVLNEETIGAADDVPTVGEGSGDEVRVSFGRMLYRGASRQDLAADPLPGR